jgi:hypothetical protein
VDRPVWRGVLLGTQIEHICVLRFADIAGIGS